MTELCHWKLLTGNLSVREGFNIAGAARFFADLQQRMIQKHGLAERVELVSADVFSEAGEQGGPQGTGRFSFPSRTTLPGRRPFARGTLSS